MQDLRVLSAMNFQRRAALIFFSLEIISLFSLSVTPLFARYASYSRMCSTIGHFRCSSVGSTNPAFARSTCLSIFSGIERAATLGRRSAVSALGTGKTATVLQPDSQPLQVAEC
jgi:hypothetical protein